MSCENVPSIHVRTAKLRSACAPVQSDQGLRIFFTESLDTADSVDKHQPNLEGCSTSEDTYHLLCLCRYKPLTCSVGLRPKDSHDQPSPDYGNTPIQIY